MIVGEPLNYGVQTPDTNKTVITIMSVNKDQGHSTLWQNIEKGVLWRNFFLSRRNNSEEI